MESVRETTNESLRGTHTLHHHSFLSSSTTGGGKSPVRDASPPSTASRRLRVLFASISCGVGER